MGSRYYHCKVCGNVLAAVLPSGVTPFCCDCKMDSLAENSIEGKGEWHVPVVERVNDCTIRVKIGKEPHPMTKEHHICFIVVETARGATIRYLDADEAPDVNILCKETPVAVYAYCNLHGVWRTTDIKGL